MHGRGLLGRGGRGAHFSYVYGIDYPGRFFFWMLFFGFGITSEPTSAEAARPGPRPARRAARRLLSPQPGPCDRSLAHGHGTLIGA